MSMPEEVDRWDVVRTWHDVEARVAVDALEATSGVPHDKVVVQPAPGIEVDNIRFDVYRRRHGPASIPVAHRRTPDPPVGDAVEEAAGRASLDGRTAPRESRIRRGPMRDEQTVVTISQRRWVSRQGDEQGHYENPTIEVTFPTRCLVHYEPTQHTLLIKEPSGQVRAAYRDVTRMLTPAVIEEAVSGT